MKNWDENLRNVINSPKILDFVVVVLQDLVQSQIFRWAALRGPKMAVVLYGCGREGLLGPGNTDFFVELCRQEI